MPASRRRRPAVRTALLLLLLASPSACATAGGDSSRAATVTLRSSRASAVRRTLDAFREQGYRVKETLTSGSEIVSEPFDREGLSWQSVPPSSFVAMTRDDMTVRPFQPALAQLALAG